MDIRSKNVLKRNPKKNRTSNEKVFIETPGLTSRKSQQIPQQLQQQDVEFYHRRACLFMNTLKRDYKRLAVIYNSCMNAEQERERRNIEEIVNLKKIYHQMQVKITNIKRKNWCRYCEAEATYLSEIEDNFYCSTECEQKHNELVSAIKDNFKIE